MGTILRLIGKLFGGVMLYIYNTIGVHNYALSLVLMTVIYKVLLLPISINQSKSTLKMQELQPELQRIQERYKNDKERLQEEQAKFYQEKGYNPMKGCLPMLIQFPIIIALFYVIRMPMAYMLKTPATAVSYMAIESVDKGYLTENNLKNITFKDLENDEISIEYLQETYQQLTKKDPYIEIKILEITNRHPEMIEANPYLSREQMDVLQGLDLRLFKIFNLGVKPTFDINLIKQDPATHLPPLILLLLAVATTYVTSSLLMGKQQSKAKDKDGNPVNAGCSGKAMALLSPIMTLVIGFQTPSGLSVYWTINNVLSFAQQTALNKIYKKKSTEEQEQDGQKYIKGEIISKDQQGSKKEENKSAKVNNKRGKKRR